MKKYFTLLALALVTLVSCDNENNEPVDPPKKEYDVYITGPTKDHTPAYWKNGVKIKLPTTTLRSSTHSVFVSNGDVYITGYETKDAVLLRAVYWKNGEKVTLPEDNSIVSSASASTWATGICVVGNDIYIAGGLEKDNGDDAEETYPVYWKNGKLVELTGGVSGAISICVEGNDVYVLDGKGYWKNGTRVKIPFLLESEYSYTTDMKIVGGDIYIAGCESLTNDSGAARYWKNGVAVTLSEDHSYTTSIFVSGGDVYVAGAEELADFIAYPTYWKNGVPVHLSEPGADSARSIIVLDNNIFVSGSCNEDGYWINEKFHPIEDVLMFEGMFVVERN